VPGFAKQTSTPQLARVSMSALAPFIVLPPLSNQVKFLENSILFSMLMLGLMIAFW